MDKLVMTEDFELYSQMKKGDREAFNTLFLKYYPVLCAFGKQIVSGDRSFSKKLFIQVCQKQMSGID